MSQATLAHESGFHSLPKQSANIYTMMLILTLLAIIVGCLFLYLEMRDYNMSIKVSADAKVPPPPPPKEEKTEGTADATPAGAFNFQPVPLALLDQPPNHFDPTA
jgi:hypothetical protein